jgi:hypothetical protein
MPLARLINCVYDNRTGKLIREEDLGFVEVREDPYAVLARIWLPELEQFLKDREAEKEEPKHR